MLKGSSSCYQKSPSKGGDSRPRWGDTAAGATPAGSSDPAADGGYIRSPSSSCGVFSRPVIMRWALTSGDSRSDASARAARRAEFAPRLYLQKLYLSDDPQLSVGEALKDCFFFRNIS